MLFKKNNTFTHLKGNDDDNLIRNRQEHDLMALQNNIINI